MTRVLALCGGVGGAKLAAGLADVVPGDELMVAVNTGDDFEHLGLTICPDLDSTLYALAGINDSVRGWGRDNESWNFLSILKELGGPTWFQLGDRDLATHVLRSHRLAQGASLSEATSELAAALGIGCHVVPMTDDPVRTVLHTDEGALSFQDYFVRSRCGPKVQRIEFTGASRARPSADVMAALDSPSLECVVICPSNPWLSIDPMLSMPNLAWQLRACDVPAIAVSPIVAGRAIKGPAADIMRSLGYTVDPASIGRHYRNFVDVLVIDDRDAASTAEIAALGIAPILASTLMIDRPARRQLAEVVLQAASRLLDRGQCSRPRGSGFSAPMIDGASLIGTR
jgi:LPPG:FO 2-phospho-L-lactate transferase